MATSSVDSGNVPPGHGAPAVVELQFPDPTVVTVPPHAVTLSSAVAKNATIKTEKIFFIVVFLYVKREFVICCFLWWSKNLKTFLAGRSEVYLDVNTQGSDSARLRSSSLQHGDTLFMVIETVACHSRSPR